MPQETIHGYPITRKSWLPDNCRYILVDRGERLSGRYVTAWHRIGDEEWSHGNYLEGHLYQVISINDYTSLGREALLWKHLNLMADKLVVEAARA